MSKIDINRLSGTLNIKDTRKGLKAWIIVNGKETPLNGFTPLNTKLRKKKATAYTQGNELLGVKLEDGDVIFGKVPEKIDKEEVDEKPKDTKMKKDKTKTDRKIWPDSFCRSKTFLPQETIESLRGLGDIDNFYLKYYKAARFDLAPGKDKVGDESKKFQFIKSGTGKKAGLDYLLKPNYGKTKFIAIAARSKAAAQAIFPRRSDLLTLDMKAQWRWIVGLGNESVYENGMTLHHVYGIPYIPGSGVKGMLRTWMIQECFERNEDKALENEVFRELFGHGKMKIEGKEKEGNKGALTFFDVFPVDKVEVEPDIINNHYQEYYDSEGAVPPADWLMPNPVFFMSAVGGQLQFNLGIPNGEQPMCPNGERPMCPNDEQPMCPFCAKMLPDRELFRALGTQVNRRDFVRAWLCDALENHGIGAKTAVGYGRMLPVPSSM